MHIPTEDELRDRFSLIQKLTLLIQTNNYQHCHLLCTDKFYNLLLSKNSNMNYFFVKFGDELQKIYILKHQLSQDYYFILRTSYGMPDLEYVLEVDNTIQQLF